MAEFKNLKTRIVLTHDDYANLKTKHLKDGEVVLAKVGEITEGNVTQPVFMMKVGTNDTTKTVDKLPWLMAPAADVYDWAKKENLEVAAIPTLPTSKIEGLDKALEDLAAEDERLVGLINGKADKVTNATAGNFAGLDANGNLTDSGSKASDFAVAGHDHDDAYAEKGHNHDTVYKKLQTAVSETGAADKTLKISQNVNGDVTATPIDIEITSTQVSGFETEVKDIVGSMGIAGSEEVAGLTTKVNTLNGDATTEGSVDYKIATALEETTFGNEDPSSEKSQLTLTDMADAINNIEYQINDFIYVDGDGNEFDIYSLHTDVQSAQDDATAAKTAIEAFLKEADSTADAIDTLKEIQAELNAGEASAASLLAEVNKIKDGTTRVPKATDADTVDGKHAADFAPADIDTGVHTVSLESGTNNGTLKLTVDGTSTDNIAVKGLGTAAFTDATAYATAAQGTKADTAIQEITTTANNGLKVTVDATDNTKVNIDIDNDIVFVLDGGTAADLD